MAVVVCIFANTHNALCPPDYVGANRLRSIKLAQGTGVVRARESDFALVTSANACEGFLPSPNYTNALAH